MRQSLYAGLICLSLLPSIMVAADAEALPMDKQIFGYTLGDYCLDKSYVTAIGKNRQAISTERNNDLDYSICIDSSCCCIQGIKNLFKEKTENMTHKRVNPAVDKMIEALRNQRMSSDDKIKELVHLKYVNTIYSFYDKDGKPMKSKVFTMPDEDGCIDTVTFREVKDLSRKGVYREGILKETLALLHAWEKSIEMIAEKNMIKMVK